MSHAIGATKSYTEPNQTNKYKLNVCSNLGVLS